LTGLAVLQAAACLVATTARADILIEVEAASEGNGESAMDGFGPEVEDAYGHAWSGTSDASAIVLPGDLCSFPGNCATIGSSASAFTDVDASRLRFRGHMVANGAGSQASVRGIVTDTLLLSSPPAPGIVTVDFHVHVAAHLGADRSQTSHAGSQLVFMVSRTEGGQATNPGDIFNYYAAADDVFPDGYTETFGAAGQSGSSIPPVFDAIASVPVIVGPGLPNSISFAVEAGYGGFAHNPGEASVSLSPSSVGVTVSQGTFTSLNGYQYLPEPDALAPALLGLSGLVRARRRRTSSSASPPTASERASSGSGR